VEQLIRIKNQRKTRFNIFLNNLNLKRVWSSTKFEFCIFNGSFFFSFTELHMERPNMLMTLLLMSVKTSDIYSCRFVMI
jgi:hypothetical protein